MPESIGALDFVQGTRGSLYCPSCVQINSGRSCYQSCDFEDGENRIVTFTNKALRGR